jgi:hypothetical protein
MVQSQTAARLRADDPTYPAQLAYRSRTIVSKIGTNPDISVHQISFGELCKPL